MIADKIHQLYQRRRFGVKLGLHVEEALLAALGHPEEAGRFIHVAGTNGKGSVCAMLASMLHAAGYTVGLYTSPHLVRFNERFVVNGTPIADDELLPLIEQVERAAGDVAREIGQEPTFFECATAMALVYFREQGVDFAVLETGLGGRLDATNVVRPRLSIVTRIGLEHTAYLGDTLEAIAGEKAGIIKPGIPVVAGDMPAKALGVLRAVAVQAASALVTASDQVAVQRLRQDEGRQTLRVKTGQRIYPTIELPLPGDHQAENLATALAAIDVLQQTPGVSIDETAVRRGLAAVRWPGRGQLVHRHPPLIVDGAHNPDAGRALAATVAETAGGRPVGLIVGMCGDKDVQRFLEPFAGIAVRLWAVPVRDARGLAPETIANIGRALGMDCAETDLGNALQAARTWALHTDGVVCATGSFFLVGELQERGDEAPPAGSGCSCRA